MQEVRFVLRFLTPCLGNRFDGRIERMPKDATGRVTFMPAWWRQVLRQVADPGEHDLIPAICVDPVVCGKLGTYQRPKAPAPGSNEPAPKVLHEAYIPSTCVIGLALLPDGLTTERFLVLLNQAGRFFGISPYGHCVGFGRFEALAVEPCDLVAGDEAECDGLAMHAAAD